MVYPKRVSGNFYRVSGWTLTIHNADGQTNCRPLQAAWHINVMH